MDQTLQRDAPPRVLVLVRNLEGGWQRHETWGFEGFFCFCQGRVSVMLSFGPHWVDELQHWVGLEKATHTLSHTYLCLSLLSSSITNVILLCIRWHIFLGSDGLGRYPEWKNTEKPSSRQFSGVKLVFSLCVSSRSHGLHGAWQRAARCIYGEKNGPAKLCKGRSDPQTNQLEEKTPTAPSFPQGAHAVLEQGEFVFNWPLTRLCWRNAATNP